MSGSCIISTTGVLLLGQCTLAAELLASVPFAFGSEDGTESPPKCMWFRVEPGGSGCRVVKGRLCSEFLLMEARKQELLLLLVVLLLLLLLPPLLLR